MEGKVAQTGGQGQRHSSPASTLRDVEYGLEYATPPWADNLSESLSKSAEGGILTKTLSRLRTNDSIDPIPPPPDGGVRAWSQALLCHLVLFKYT